MYCSHFGLHRSAFNNTPDPTFYYSTPDHEEALATLHYATQQRKGFVLITGEVGAGKTLIGRMFLRQIEPQAETAIIAHTHLSGRQLLAAICAEFELDPCEGASNLKLSRLLQDYLLDQFARDRFVVVVLDEAQNLPDEGFEELRMLGNLEADDAKLLQVCILGQPELRNRFARPNMRQLEQRLFRRFHLPALAQESVYEYISHRLKVAGCTNDELFTPGAIDKVFAASKGIPRLINQICDNAMLAAYARNVHTINAQIIDDVLDRDGPPQTSRQAETRVEAHAARAAEPRHEQTDRRIEQIYRSKPVITGAAAGESDVGRTDSTQPPEATLDRTRDIQEQVVAVNDPASCGQEDSTRIARRQNKLHKIVDRATEGWLSTKEKLEAYRKDIQGIVDNVVSQCQSTQRQFEELSRTAVPAEHLEEVRRIYLNDTNRVLGEIARQRAEFQRLTDQAEAWWSEDRNRMAELSTTAATNEALAELDAQHGRRIQDVLGRLDEYRDRVAGLIDTVRQGHERTQDSLSALRKSYTQGHTELAERVDAKLADACRGIGEQLEARAEDVDALRHDYTEAINQLLEQMRRREHEISSLSQQVASKFDATHELIEELESKSANTDELQRVRAEHATAVSDVVKRFTEETAALKEFHQAIAEQSRAASDEQKSQFKELADRVTNQARQLQDLRQKMLTHHAVLQKRMNELGEQFARREEVEELRQAQDRQSADLFSRIETNYEAMQELIQGVVERCRSTQAQLDAVASSKNDKEEFTRFRAKQEEDVARLLQLLDDQRRGMQEQFEQTMSRWTQAQESIEELSANAAEAELVEEVRGQQARDTERILATIASQRRDLESLVDAVNRRCDQLVERMNELPDDLATTDDLKSIQADHARQVRRFSQDIATRKIQFARAVKSLAGRCDQTQKAVEALAARAASIEDLQGLRKQHSEHQQKVADLDRRWSMLDKDLKTLAASTTPTSAFKEVEQSLSCELALLDERIDEIKTAHEEHLNTLVGAVHQTTERVTTLEDQGQPRPVNIELAPEAGRVLGDLVASAQAEREQLNEQLGQAGEVASSLRGLASQIQEMMQNWRDHAHQVQRQSDQLRTSAKMASNILTAMQRCHVVLDAKLNSEQWQAELARSQDLSTRLEQATHAAHAACELATQAAHGVRKQTAGAARAASEQVTRAAHAACELATQAAHGVRKQTARTARAASEQVTRAAHAANEQVERSARATCQQAAHRVTKLVAESELAARQATSQIAKLVAESETAAARFDQAVEGRRQMLTAIAKNAAGLAEVIETAGRFDEQRHPSPSAAATGKTKPDAPPATEINWPKFRTHQVQAS